MALVPLCVQPISAQETRSVIFGRVTDPQNAAVAGAAVSVVNTNTNVALNSTTNDTGYYEADFVVAGNYRVTVTMPGFKK